METFSLHSLIMVPALLVCVFPFAHLAVIDGTGSGDEDWSSVAYRVRGLRSTQESDEPATIITALIPWRQQIPEGGQIGLDCISQTPNCGYKSFLYKVDGDKGNVQDSNLTSCGTCTGCRNGDCTFITNFTMKGTLEASGTYGCKVILTDGPQPTASVDRTGLDGNRPHEATVIVCEEPEIEMNIQNLNNYTTVNASDNCNFASELSWRINGRLIPRESADLPPPAAVHRDTGLLKIRTSCDRFASRTPCNVTAEFSYISAHRRLKVARRTIRVLDCCGFLPSTEVPTKPFQTQQPKEPMTMTDKQPSWQEKWDLKKEVLLLKKNLLPLQIKFFKNWNRANPKRLSQVVAEAVMDD